MLNAKKSGRVFYPSKATHSRHNSHDETLKSQREELSPLNRSHDSTCNSSSGSTDSSSKNGSGSKLVLNKLSSERTKKIIPIRLNFEDEPAAILPTLVMEVVSSSEDLNYELEKSDVRAFFEKFGPVTSVDIQENSNKAVVVMEDVQHGHQAEKYLNFYQLAGTNAYLTVKWKLGNLENLQKAAHKQREDEQKIAFEGQTSLSTGQSSPVGNNSQAYGSSPKRQMNKECTSVSKFTCKYEIPIKNLPGFSAARKIIGHRGRNMKSILDKLKDNHFRGPVQDVLKLRLRGQGSGFKEGPHNCESPEPLHLCVSSKYFEKYTEACGLVEKLLKDVYVEYNNYCRWKGKAIRNIKIEKTENNPASYLSNYSNKTQQ